MGLYEFIVLNIDQKADEVWNNGIFLSTYYENGHAFMLYKLPEFYAEIKYCKSQNKIIDVVGFTKGWKLDKHLDCIKIDVF